MTNIRSVDMLFLDEVFGMGGGYVLNFSDRTFSQFFAEELNIDIDDPLYAQNGSSKGKCLRCFLQTVDKSAVVRTLNALWEYREALRQRAGQADKVENAGGRLLTLINRIEGRPGNAPAHTKPPAPRSIVPASPRSGRISSPCQRSPAGTRLRVREVLEGPFRRLWPRGTGALPAEGRAD